ncbi:MAG TPA: DUF2339 domain-containing protein [Gemmatimonadales bacterium]|nr:DUF2339 domain-containing protein [Gemmatimonadales bacterium]
MTEQEREAIERLERRVALLEEAVRRLIAARTVPDPGRALRGHDSAPPAAAPRSRPPPLPAPADLSPATRPFTAPATDLEQWFGQRGLLVVGVVALLAAAAFFLKYAFDRGWIPPLLRSLLALGAGIGVGAWGEQRIRRGMQRYGAAMIGAGGGLVYLGLWAAAGPYALIDRRVGVLLLAATAVAVTLLALHHDIEGLALWALVGAYVAPIILQPPVPNPEAYLGYLEVIGLGTGLLAYTMSWRRTFDLALFGYLVLAAVGAATALRSPLGCWLVTAGVLLALHATHHRAWPEARLGVLLLGWAILGGSLSDIRGSASKSWLALGAAAAVSGLLWWQQLERDPFAADRRSDPRAAADRFLFVANPVAFLLLAYAAGLRVLEDAPGALPALLGAIYLSAGWLRRSASQLIMGFALGAVAMALEWQATTVVLGCTALAGAALAAERLANRPGGRAAAVGLALTAALFLCAALWSREPHAPVFSDRWALALYVYIAGMALCAREWGPEAPPGAWERRGRELLWILCGAAAFLGGSIQLGRHFGRSSALAGDLALSLWWLVYAGALVSLGFRLNRKAVRSAGLAVAAAAGLKIVLYDLATLEALYRVASFFALALIALTVAYAYNRKASRGVAEGEQ